MPDRNGSPASPGKNATQRSATATATATTTRKETAMPAPIIAAHYHARDGTEHQVLVERSPEGRWRVLDAVENDAIVVDTLTGYDDRLDQAAALARDYAAEQQAHHDGARLDDPLPKHRPAASEEPSCAA
jgi:hypothetical protein